MCEVKVYLTNLAKYNAGELFGKWVDLPLTEEELDAELREVLGTDEEYFITDYEAPFDIHEYENLRDLNSFADELHIKSEYDVERIIYLLKNVSNDWQYALNNYEDVVFYKDMTLEDVARDLVEEGLFGDLSDNIKSYIDFERLGDHLSMDGYHETEKGTFWCS
ncbi:MAG: antirestriction protein ArdA [Candidatus Omnitrophica bacterium]|nr:antirestriction protein ArdA [Candidatus Omnitrophota bacterium]